MKKESEDYRRFIFIGNSIIALGITFSTILKETVGSFGIVLIAVGGLFFIIGMSKKQKEKNKENK